MTQEKLKVELETPNFQASAESFRVFIQKEAPKTKKDEKSFPVRIRRITLTCKRSGEVIKFPLTVRNDVATFGDSRQTARVEKRWTIKDMRVELARMLGEDIADRLINVAMYS